MCGWVWVGGRVHACMRTCVCACVRACVRPSLGKSVGSADRRIGIPCVMSPLMIPRATLSARWQGDDRRAESIQERENCFDE